MVMQKIFNLNPTQFFNIIKSLPVGFQERIKIILKDNLTFLSCNDKKLGKTQSFETLSVELHTPLVQISFIIFIKLFSEMKIQLP